jgi:hypothetical protein
MNEENSAPRFKAGDIVQERGHGRGMVVADSKKFEAPWWGDVPDAVACEWTEDGYPRDMVYRAQDLELVGSQRRRSDAELYEKLTSLAVQLITEMAIEGNHHQALGAFRMWAGLTGPQSRDDDALRLQQLVDRAASKP